MSKSKTKSKSAAERSITEEIAELRAMPVPGLVDRYEKLHGKPPRVKNRAWLWRRCAWKLQEQRFGGLSEVAKRRLDELIADLDIDLTNERTVRAKVNGTARRGEPVVGTTLTRTWKGREIHATRTEDGWEHDGVVYRSLSAVVKAITGSHASGPAWFGLVARKGAKA